MAVTPTPAAYRRDNPRPLGRGPEKWSGLRVWVETPWPPVLGKERYAEYEYIFGERSIRSTGSGGLVLEFPVRQGNGELHPTSATGHDPPRQIRPPDHRPAHL